MEFLGTIDLNKVDLNNLTQLKLLEGRLKSLHQQQRKAADFQGKGLPWNGSESTESPHFGARAIHATTSPTLNRDLNKASLPNRNVNQRQKSSAAAATNEVVMEDQSQQAAST